MRTALQTIRETGRGKRRRRRGKRDGLVLLFPAQFPIEYSDFRYGGGNGQICPENSESNSGTQRRMPEIAETHGNPCHSCRCICLICLNRRERFLGSVRGRSSMRWTCSWRKGNPLFLISVPCSPNKYKVYAAGSEDMDTLTFSAPILFRHLTFSEAKKQPISEINLEKALEGLKMNMSQVRIPLTFVWSFNFFPFCTIVHRTVHLARLWLPRTNKGNWTQICPQACPRIWWTGRCG
jgi:hypothetical protein